MEKISIITLFPTHGSTLSSTTQCDNKTKTKGFHLIIKLMMLCIAWILFAGNDISNPIIGKSNIEFYAHDVRKSLQQSFETTHNKTVPSQHTVFAEFYGKRNYLPVWTINFYPTDQFDTLLYLLDQAENYGLISQWYNYDKMKTLAQGLVQHVDNKKRFEQRMQLEKMATSALFRFSAHIAIGSNFNRADSSVKAFLNMLPTYFDQILKNGSLKQGILSLQPQNEYYSSLQKALEKYLKENELEEKILNNILLEKAIHLDSTKSQYNKFIQIAINLDRSRKDQIKDDTYVFVNIPEFKLSYFHNNTVMGDYKVVVGKKTSPTPNISSEIHSIIANPLWNVPQSIVLNEMIDKIKADPFYLEDNGYFVTDSKSKIIDDWNINWDSINYSKLQYWIKQRNGNNNALGKLKFLFKNNHSVYLHDTQAKKYFDRKKRLYSHGCVRVKNPESLAQLITDTRNKSKQDFDQLLSTNKRYPIAIENPLPIHIKYFTCSVDSSNSIIFLEDVYNKDHDAIEQFTLLSGGI